MTRPAPQRTSEADRDLVLERLRGCGFDAAGCPPRLGIDSMRDALRPVQVFRSLGAMARAKPRTGGGADALDLVLALLVFGERVPRRRLADALGSEWVAALERLRLVERKRGDISAHHIVLPWHGLYLVTDRLEEDPGTNRVMPLFSESHDLPELAPVRPLGCVLDLCTGSGVHALVAAGRATEAVGVDVSPRAVSFAGFNAWLNAVPNARFLLGDLFAPVAEARTRYGLVTANPPYNPDLQSRAGDDYRSGGESGEEVLARIVAGVPGVLAEDGLAQIITLLIHREDDPLAARIRRWAGAAGEGLDLLLLARDVNYRPLVLAGAPNLSPAERALAESWKRQRITRFQFGVIHLRRTPADREPVSVELPLPGSSGPGRLRVEAALEAASRATTERSAAAAAALRAAPE